MMSPDREYRALQNRPADKLPEAAIDGQGAAVGHEGDKARNALVPSVTMKVDAPDSHE